VASAPTVTLNVTNVCNCRIASSHLILATSVIFGHPKALFFLTVSRKDPVDPLVLAKCWTLDDQTLCLLSKVGASTWELRVTRGTRLLRVELFGNLSIAVAAARDWRRLFSAENRDIA
jgi:hypothetical protein